MLTGNWLGLARLTADSQQGEKSLAPDLLLLPYSGVRLRHQGLLMDCQRERAQPENSIPDVLE